MNHPLEELRAAALAEIAAASDEQALDAARVRYLGRSGSISAWGEQMKSLSKEERPVVGKLLNEVRTAVTAALDETGGKLHAAKEIGRAGRPRCFSARHAYRIGALHPLTQLLDRAIGIFRRMGFALADGPDVEDEWHCFDALNTPPDHPARNEQDTFYLPDGRLLRTHTSTVQIRTMESAPPPIRIIAPGAAYRRDEVDATHLAQFHQIEGLYVDRTTSAWPISRARWNFSSANSSAPDTEVRFRPHFFPFTEPSFEIDVKSKALKGGEQWMEVCGCGMVDPAVFEEVNRARGDKAYDPEKWTGFAFGFGLDRLAMILFGMPDIRLFTQNDLRFLGTIRVKIS